jgi:co-chaperonin GroES (HSP10)
MATETTEEKKGFGEQYWDERNLPNRAYEFPRKPLLDRIIVREIPIAEYYEQSEGIHIALRGDEVGSAHIKQRSDRGEVMAVGDCVPMGGVMLPMPVKVGDVVTFQDTCMVSPIFLNPAHKNRPDLPKYWLMRVADLDGIVL